MGLRASLETIDNRSDFKTYMQHYAFAHGGANYTGPRRRGPESEGFVSPRPQELRASYSKPLGNASCRLYPPSMQGDHRAPQILSLWTKVVQLSG